MPPSPRRSSSSARLEIRPGVAIAAGAILTLAIGVLALSSTRSARESRAPASRVAALVPSPETASSSAERRAAAPESADAAPLALPSRTVALRPAPSDARQAHAAPAGGAEEPVWDGRGMPSREWVRWQLETLVTQAHPYGSISKGALESAVDDALAVRAAKLEMQQAKDSEALVTARERLEHASQNLAANLGIEGIDFSAF